MTARPTEANAELEQEATHLVACLHPIAHEWIKYPVQGRQRLLGFRFGCQKLHGRTHEPH